MPMNTNKIDNIELSKDEIEELNNYKKYLKYSRNGLIKSGNKNWLIIDSSKTKSMNFIKEISSINTLNFIPTYVIRDIQFTTNRYGFDENKFLSSIEISSNACYIIVVSTFNSDIAISKFNTLYTFFIDYNSNNESVFENKKDKIEKYIENNNFKVEDKEILNALEIVPSKELEATLTKAFINALNNHSNILKPEYIESKSENLSVYINELKNLIGLNNVKKTLLEIVNYLKISKERNDIPVLNMCFLGNPGTGKTTVAKLVGKILSAIKVFGSTAPFVEVSREKLIGKFIGHTESNVLEAIKNATGGILFIDEAYSLTEDSEDSRDYGNRAVDVLVNELDIHKRDLCVIFAGYKDKMINFLKSNPGLESRIPFKIEFKDYTENELLEIFNTFIIDSNLYLDIGTEEILLNHFKQKTKQSNFGNGRYVRNFFERLKIKQANRIVQDNNNDLNKITQADILNTITSMKEIREEHRKIGF